MLQDLFGRRIRLTDERIAHILERHPYMAELWDEVAETLREAEEIRRSNSDPETVRLYHKWYYGTSQGDKWMCVAVKVFPNDAYILTAYVTPEIEGAIRCERLGGDERAFRGNR
jgi:hypothetical protein